MLDKVAAICPSFQTVKLSAHNSLTAVKTKIEQDSHVDTHVVGNKCLVQHDHKRPVNVFRYYPKAESKHVHIVNATVARTEPETGQVVIHLINQEIKMKGLEHQLLCLMQCCMNSALINKVSKFFIPIPGKTMHAIQLEDPFDATYPVIIALRLNKVSSYFKVRVQA